MPEVSMLPDSEPVLDQDTSPVSIPEADPKLDPDTLVVNPAPDMNCPDVLRELPRSVALRVFVPSGVSNGLARSGKYTIHFELQALEAFSASVKTAETSALVRATALPDKLAEGAIVKAAIITNISRRSIIM